MADVDLMQVAGSFRDLATIVLGRGDRHPVGLVCSFVRFELVSLLEAHFEIMHALISLVLLDALLVNDGLTWLTHAALVLTHVVELVAAHVEVWLGVTVALKDLVSLFLSQLHGCHLLLVSILVDETLLRSGLWHFEVLLGEVRLSKLVDELKSALLGL